MDVRGKHERNQVSRPRPSCPSPTILPPSSRPVSPRPPPSPSPPAPPLSVELAVRDFLEIMSDNEEHDNESVRGLAGGCLSVELDEARADRTSPFLRLPLAPFSREEDVRVSRTPCNIAHWQAHVASTIAASSSSKLTTCSYPAFSPFLSSPPPPSCHFRLAMYRTTWRMRRWTGTTTWPTERDTTERTRP